MLYIGPEHIQQEIQDAFATASDTPRHLICDLSNVPMTDITGVQMLRKLQQALAAQEIRFRLVGAHARVRDVLLRDGLDRLATGIEHGSTLDTALGAIEAERGSESV